MGFPNPNSAITGVHVGHSSAPTPASPPVTTLGSNAGNRFSTDNARMAQPPAPVSPGHGAIPVRPGETEGPWFLPEMNKQG